MKLLIVLSRVPFPLDKGDKLRAYHQLKQLSQFHEIDLVALNDTGLHPDAMKELEPFCASIRVFKLNAFSIAWNSIKVFFNGMPFQVGYFTNRKVLRQVQNWIEERKPDHVFGQLVRTAEYIRNFEGGKTLDFQDALSMGMKRRADKSNSLRRWFFLSEYRRLRKYEQRMLSVFDHCTIISNPDRMLIQNQSEKPIHVIANGVDFDFFKPVERKKEYELVFIGNMNYPPNIRTAHYLVNKVLPMVHKQMPGVKLLLGGATPHESVKRLASDSVHVSGWMDDIRDAYASAQIFVAPMQIGTGLQNKLLEAMAMKIPCVTSELANNALNAREKEEVLVGSTPEEYAVHIIRLLNNPYEARMMSENAYHFVRKNYSWEESAKQLSEIFNT